MQGGGGTSHWRDLRLGTDNGGDIAFGTNSTITGALWAADDLTIAGGSTMNYVLADHVAPRGRLAGSGTHQPFCSSASGSRASWD